ncbi:MAG: dTDP-4-dehydrorhamnose 3,5-epimerase family protein [Verrucomicrobiota bacterium]
MRFSETNLPGAFVIDPERHADERGFFARTWCREEFAAHALETKLIQCSVSFNTKAGTLRGLHSPILILEVKLVRYPRRYIRCDRRFARGLGSFRHHFSVTLTAENGRALYIPGNLAHGFLTLEPGTEVFYQMSESFRPDYARGVRWNDPALWHQLAPTRPGHLHARRGLPTSRPRRDVPRLGR